MKRADLNESSNTKLKMRSDIKCLSRFVRVSKSWTNNFSKVTNIFKIEKVKVPKTVAERKVSLYFPFSKLYQIYIGHNKKQWKKFGDSINDPPGVNSATTVVSDEVLMQFLNNKEVMVMWKIEFNSYNILNNDQEVDRTESIPTAVPVKCRLCKGDHWSAKCPHKDLLEGKILNEGGRGKFKLVSRFMIFLPAWDYCHKDTGASSGGAYKPPSMRAGASQSSSTGKKMDFGKGPLNKGEPQIWLVIAI